MVHNGYESFFVMDVKSTKSLDPILVELKEVVLQIKLRVSPRFKVGYAFQMLMS